MIDDVVLRKIKIKISANIDPCLNFLTQDALPRVLNCLYGICNVSEILTRIVFAHNIYDFPN